MALLEVRNVSRYFGGLKAVVDCSLDVPERSITGLIGPNGAGKTTLFNVISGFLPATSGEILFCGEDIAGRKPNEIAERGIARTFQTPHGLAGMTVMENLVVAPLRQEGERLSSLVLAPKRIEAQEMLIGEKACLLLEFFGFLHLRGELLGNLSAGEARIVEFARQLMLEPKLLLLDEPAAGIEPTLQQRIANIIQDMREKGMTFLVVDHNLGFICGITDYIYVMDKGRIIASGPPEAVIRDKNVREVYLGDVA